MLKAMESDTSSDRRPVIPASEILAKIERGEDVEYDGVIVEGDLDISGLNLPTEHIERMWYVIERLNLAGEAKTITSPISITNSEFQGAATFTNSVFLESVNFMNTKFCSEVDFRAAQFKGNVDFWKTQFSSDVHFEWAEFIGNAIFWNAQFSGSNADFSDTRFCGNANFWVARFSRGDADFRVAQFSVDASFWVAQFSGFVDFRGSKFNGDADFNVVHFNSGANLRGVQFFGCAHFFRAQFKGGADFEGVQFHNELVFDGLEFDKLYNISWRSIRDHLVCDGPTYLRLIKNFKVIERFSDADDCYYQYRKESQSQKIWYSGKNRVVELLVRCYIWISNKAKRISEYLSWINNYPPFTWIHRFNWSKLLDWVGFVSCGYGVRLGPIFFWVFGSVLSFTLLYKLLPQSFGGIAESGPSTVTMEAVNNSTLLFTFSSGDGAVSPSWGECLYFSFTALTGGTPDGLHPVGLCKYAVMIEGVLGYLFLALFVVVLARKIIR